LQQLLKYAKLNKVFQDSSNLQIMKYINSIYKLWPLQNKIQTLYVVLCMEDYIVQVELQGTWFLEVVQHQLV